jgi:hypothetical protein
VTELRAHPAVTDRHLPESEQVYPDADEHQRTGGAESGDVRVGEDVAEQQPDDGEAALDHEDGQGAGSDPPAEGRGEGDRGEPVER